MSAAYLQGQVNCSTNGGITQPLVCLLPFSLAGNNNTFLPTSQDNQVAKILLPINGSIAVQLTQLPVPSGATGTITLFDKGSVQGHAFDDLGPVLTDQPGTIGKNHMYLGSSYQRFRFNALDGIGLGDLRLGYAITDSGTTYYSESDGKINFKLDQYVVSATYGASKTTDISVVVPYNSISLSTLTTNIKEYRFDGTYYTTTAPPPNPPLVKGNANGVGDVTFNVKQLLYGGSGNNLAIAAGFGFRIPSGDVYNYLGSGAYGGDLYGLVSYRSYKYRFSPHFKLGKQWNGPTPILNPTGAGDVRLPGGMQYDAGTDIRILKKLTLSVDVLGNQFVNGTSLSAASPIVLGPIPNASNTRPVGSAIPPATLTVAQPVNNTYTTINLSSGLKYKPRRGLLLYGNVLVQTNNVGLRSDPVPLVGASYNFNFGKTDQ